MPKYAIKIGEVHLRSDKPITPEEHKKALKELRRADPLIATQDGLQVKLTIDRH